MTTIEARPTAAEFSIKVKGSKVPQDFMARIYKMEVEQSLHLPDVFTFWVHLDATEEKAFDIVDGTIKDYLNSGAEVEIAHHVNNRDTTIVKGEVTSVSLDLSSAAPGSPVSVIIQGYDKSHRLHRGRQSRTYLNTKYSDIAANLAGEAKLSIQADSTPGVFDHVIQNNQTNWEFLLQLARRVGYDFYFDDDKLMFKKADAKRATEVELKWGTTLSQFYARATTAQQVSEVTVRGWDVINKMEIVGKATNGKGFPEVGDGRSGSDQAKSAFGEAKLNLVDVPVQSQAEADTMAQSLADAAAGNFVTAEGVTAEGTPAIKPRILLKITGMGKRLSGKYYVTSATHRFTPKDGYTTSFVVSGRRPYTLLELVDSDSSSAASGNPLSSVIGLVTNVKDPKYYGRVKVKYPWLGEQIESDWARLVAPGAGKDRGMQWLPEVDDEVLLAFEHGDIHRPYVVGGLWNKKDMPPVANAEANDQRIIKSRSGHVIILDDKDGAEKIIIRDKTEKNAIIIDSAENTLTISIEKDITIKALGQISVESTQNMSLKSSGNMSIEAGGNLDMKATGNLSAEATGNFSAKGLQAAMEGTTQADVKGLNVSLEGSAMAVVKGAIVMIN